MIRGGRRMKVRWKGKTDFLVLTYNKIYEVIAVEKDWYRIIDDSGEDYLYPPDLFEIVEEWWIGNYDFIFLIETGAMELLYI